MKPDGSCPKIYVVTTYQLQYELLSFCLENELGAKCVFHSEIPATSGKGGTARQVWLLDCMDLVNDSLDKHFTTFLRTLPKDTLTALFNVKPQSGLENFIMQNRICGIFYNNDSRQVFLKGIRTILDGQMWISRKTLSKCMLNQHYNSNPCALGARTLSKREKSILGSVASGASNQQIADELNVSVHTIKAHLYKIYRKINVHNRLQATVWINTCLCD